MRILFIITSFNGLSQRAWVELDRLNHQVRLHTVSTSEKMIDAVNEYKPDLIIAPYLKKVIPEIIWKNYTCLIVHPGIVGDRGSSSLDWAILNNKKEWGVTILQAVEKMDAGPVWAYETFAMRNVAKSFLYRHEVTQAATKALLKAGHLFEQKNFIPRKNEEIIEERKGKWSRSTNEDDFKFTWDEDAVSIIKKIHAADSFPGVRCSLLDEEYFCYGAAEEEILKGVPGEIIAQRDNAVCVATGDTSLWIQCLKKKSEEAIKLPAAMVLGDKIKNIPFSAIDYFAQKGPSVQKNSFGGDNNLSVKTFREIWYEEQHKDIGYLHFEFYNGAMSTEQCLRLKDAFIEAKQRQTKVIVLMGGEDIWSNGIHLNVIEASQNPAQTSWENINAIDDLIKEIICTDTHYIVSALQGNAGAGGVALALAADKVIATKGIVLNPHTRNMGLYGSEYWTYLLPKRIGTERANLFTEQCLPWGTGIALEVKLIDDCFEETGGAFRDKVKITAEEIAKLSYFSQLLNAKKFKRRRDESYRPLQKYRDEELEKMHKNFFDDDWGYDWKRHCFVYKIDTGDERNSIGDKDFFSERRKIWRRRKDEKMFYEV